MTVLRLIAVAVLEAVIVLAAVTAVFWAAVGPQGFATVAWLAVMFVTVAGSGVALERLARRRRGGAQFAGRPDYRRIAELERGLYGHAFPEGDGDE